MAGKFFGPVRWRFSGNRTLAQRYVGVARSLLGQLEESMGFQALMHLRHEWRIPSGVVITALSTHGQRMVYIHAPESGARYFPSACISKLIMDSGFVHMAMNQNWQAYPLRVGLTDEIESHWERGTEIPSSAIPTGTGPKKTATYVMLPPPALQANETGAKNVVTTAYGRVKQAIFPVCGAALFTRPHYPDLAEEDIGRYKYYESLITSFRWELQAPPGSTSPRDDQALPAYRWSGLMRLWVQAQHGVNRRIEHEGGLYDPDSVGLIMSRDYWTCYLVSVPKRGASVATAYKMVQGVSRGYARLLENPTFSERERTRMLSYMFAYMTVSDVSVSLPLNQVVLGEPFVYGWHWSYTDNTAVMFTGQAQLGADSEGVSNYYRMRKYTLDFSTVSSDRVTMACEMSDEGRFRPDANANFMLYRNDPYLGRVHICLMPPDPRDRTEPLGDNVRIYGFYNRQGSLLTLRYQVIPGSEFVDNSVIRPAANGIPGKVPCELYQKDEPVGIPTGDGAVGFRTSSGYQTYNHGVFSIYEEYPNGTEIQRFMCKSTRRSGRSETLYLFSIGGSTSVGFTYQFPTVRYVGTAADYPCEDVPLGSIYSSGDSSETIQENFVVNWCDIYESVYYGPSSAITAAITAMENPDSLHLLDYMNPNVNPVSNGVRMPGASVILTLALGENDLGVGGSSTYTPVYTYAASANPLQTGLVLSEDAAYEFYHSLMSALDTVYFITPNNELETRYTPLSEGKGFLNRYLQVFSISKPYVDAVILTEEGYSGAARIDVNGTDPDKDLSGMYTRDLDAVYFVGWA